MQAFFKERFNQKAQAAAELAVFGAILIFVIGIMIRSALSTSFTQNQTLKALRMAFQLSFESANSSFDNNTGETSRNLASLLFIEDRLTADVNKYGALTRTPYVVSASGTFTKNLLKPTDWPTHGETNEIPVFDVFINGKHFTFTLAGFKEYDVSFNAPAPHLNKFPPGPSRQAYQQRWDNERDPACGGASGGGCRLFFVISSSTKSPGDSSTTGPNFCIVDPCPVSNFLNADARFDLNRDGTTDVPANAADNNEQRKNFAWQWLAFPANSKEIDLQAGKNNVADVDGDLHEEQILEYFDYRGRVYSAEKGPANAHAAITKVRVLDSQEGDLDFSSSNDSGGPRVGLTNEISMYTRTAEGTYLLIQEGKRFNPELNPSVRSTQKRNQIDIVQRSIQLSNDTGRFCDRRINPEVDVCSPTNNGCFGSNIDKTCFARDTKILYVRSRIIDQRGRRWITDITRGSERE